MANKVITIGRQTTSANTSSQETYRDISMDAKPASAMRATLHSAPASSKYKIDKLVDAAAVQKSLEHLFTWIPGERILDPEYGSKLRLYLYEGITDTNVEKIMAEIRRCVSVYEPRVIIDQVVNIASVENTENNTVELEIRYHIVGLPD